MARPVNSSGRQLGLSLCVAKQRIGGPVRYPLLCGRGEGRELQ